MLAILLDAKHLWRIVVFRDEYIHAPPFPAQSPLAVIIPHPLPASLHWIIICSIYLICFFHISKHTRKASTHICSRPNMKASGDQQVSRIYKEKKIICATICNIWCSLYYTNNFCWTDLAACFFVMCVCAICEFIYVCTVVLLLYTHVFSSIYK